MQLFTMSGGFCRRNGKLAYLTTVAALALLNLPQSAAAQSGASNGPPSLPRSKTSGGAAVSQPGVAHGVEEVIVTAERRSQRLQSVPISITALTASGLAKAGIANIVDLPQVTAGLVAPSSVSGNAELNPFIRGVGSDSGTPGVDASVALYVDGVYSASKFLNLIDLDNVARVEVLKGPQGTLYGRNATGGAINVITQRPSANFGGDASVSYGEYNETVEKGYITGPLAPGLNGSLSDVSRQGGDYGNDRTTGNKFGGLDSSTVNGQLAWTPTSRLDVLLSGTYVNRQGREFGESYVIPSGGIPLGGQFGGLFSTQPNVSYTDVDPKLDVHGFNVALHLRYSLDNVDLVSVTAYEKGRYKTQLDADATSLPIETVKFTSPSRAYSQEFEAVSTAKSPFQWIVGAYYLNSREAYSPFEVDVAPISVQYFTFTDANAQSAFAQISYQFDFGTKITAGARYSSETRTLDGLLSSPTLGNAVLAGPINLGKTFNAPTWRFSIDQKLAQGLLAYASYNRGFKSGAYNILAVDPNQKPVNPEILDAYEVGVKSQLADRTIQLNGAFYYYDYKNIQVEYVELGSSAAVLENAAAAKLYGLDADIVVVPIRALQLNAGFNLEHSDYSSYQGASGFATANGIGIGTSFDETGRQVIGAPDLSFNVGGSYTLDIGEVGSLSFASNYAYNTRYAIAAGEGNYIRAQGILNGNAVFTARKHGYSVELWGKNLTDVRNGGEYTTAVAESLFIHRPRTYGATVSVKF